MLTLAAKALGVRNIGEREQRLVVRIETNASDNPENNHALLVSGSVDMFPRGYAAYLLLPGESGIDQLDSNQLIISLPESLSYLGRGDIVSFSSHDRKVRVLYRHNSRHNNFLVTERCDNYCLMCSQPPKDVDDKWVIEEILQAIPLGNH